MDAFRREKKAAEYRQQAVQIRSFAEQVLTPRSQVAPV